MIIEIEHGNGRGTCASVGSGAVRSADFIPHPSRVRKNPLGKPVSAVRDEVRRSLTDPSPSLTVGEALLFG